MSAHAFAAAMTAPERLPSLRLTCHPSLAVVRSPHAVVSLWAAHQGAGAIGDVDPYQAEDALVVRRALDVEVLRLPGGAAAFVQALAAGHPLGAAAAQGQAEAPDFDLAAILTLLLRADAITSLQPDSGASR